MAKKRHGGTGSRQRAFRWAGLSLLLIGLFTAVSLLSFDPGAYAAAAREGRAWLPGSSRVAEFAEEIGAPRGLLAGWTRNSGGGLGVLWSGFLLLLFGWPFVGAVPVVLIAWGWNRLLLWPTRVLAIRSALALPFLVVASTLVAALGGGRVGSGLAGMGLWSAVEASVGPAGGILLMVLLAAGFFALEAELWDGKWGHRTIPVLVRLGAWIRSAARLIALALAALFQKTLQGAKALWVWALASFRVEQSSLGRTPVPVEGVRGSLAPVHAVVKAPEVKQEAPPTIVDPVALEPLRPAPVPAPAHLPPPIASPPPRPVREDLPEPRDVEAAVLEARRLARTGSDTARGSRRGKMVVPGAEILDDVPEIGPPVAETELLENSQTLTETLRDFGITGRVTEVHPGPVITRYEIQPGPGVKVSQILNRADDLALKLKATRIRILGHIPGKAAVGVEVPNRNPSPIFLRRLLETHAFRDATGPLPLALGKDIGGAPVITELSKMPHLLIAGTTGSGKSVCMNAIVTSLLLKRTPEELRLLMVDPKMLELPMYNGIPHLLTEVVTDPKLAARTLRWLLLEMERRYRVLAARGSRNIQSYNAKVESEGAQKEEEGKLPYIVVLIDELADLMITSGNEIEEPIARLAQTARAVGIHLVVATQRPSVDVITGVIKANFPSRIAFQVASKTDSRTILDGNGAESLLGKGDMLYLPPGTGFPQRVHGAFVSESETQRLAEAWRRQGEPEPHPGLEEAMAEPEASGLGPGDDPLFEEAARLVVAAGQASASMLQRRLKVGYARAARLVDMLEGAGVVSSSEGSKPRDILVDEVRLEHLLAGAHTP